MIIRIIFPLNIKPILKYHVKFSLVRSIRIYHPAIIVSKKYIYCFVIHMVCLSDDSFDIILPIHTHHQFSRPQNERISSQRRPPSTDGTSRRA